MKRAALASIAIVVLGWAQPALAQRPPNVEARAAFEAGQAAYDAGRFQQALDYFLRAYELTNEPDVLFNIATVHDRLRHDREALEAYRSYLEARPNVAERANIEARIAVLEAAIARGQSAPPEEGTDEQPPPEEEASAEPPIEAEPARVPAPSDPAPWIVAGIGGALVVAGVVLLVVTQLDIDTVSNGTSWAEIQDAYDRVPILSGVGFGALGLGAAMLTAGIIWGVIGSGGSSTEVAIGPGSLRVRGSF